MDRDEECQGHYWIPQQQAQGIHHGNGQVQMDCLGDSGEPPVDSLLDRSGLFDELVCQILDESQPNKEAEVPTLNRQEHPEVKDEAIQDNFQGLQMTSPADSAPVWVERNEGIHENTRLPKFPPGITKRPENPASFEMMFHGKPQSGAQGGIPPSQTSREEQSVGAGQPSCNGAKGLLEYPHPGHLMRGDHLEAPYFAGNFPSRPVPGTLPSSGGDCGGMPSSSGSQGGSQAAGNLSKRNHALAYQGRRSSPVPEDPHQYFRQRVHAAAAAAQQAQSREQFPRQTRPASAFPNSEPAASTPFPSGVNLKTQLMQMNNWADVNKFVAAKGNLNLQTGNVAFNQNQFPGNLNTGKAAYGQNRMPNYQFPHRNMPPPQAIQVANQNQGTFQPTSHKLGLNGQFQQQYFPVRPEIYNQNVPAWPQPHQQGSQNDSHTYLSQLHVHLESCYYQFYSVEKERKKTEIELSRLNPGRRISSANTIQTPQLPEYPTSLDRMIVDFYKEHSRVYTLMSKIGGLCAEALHPSIDACLDNWVEAIQEAGLKRREELRRAQDGTAERSEQRGYVLVDVIEKLAKATRSIRTALWCALQLSKESRLAQNEDTPSSNQL